MRKLRPRIEMNTAPTTPIGEGAGQLTCWGTSPGPITLQGNLREHINLFLLQNVTGDFKN